ncbi:hypothetical protein [Cupriavidus sp. TMH.W2]|uniref:hypothetical protein n=1 Tax=Cupriavidus sp. TMH.W2 TaxID=3434465 RepID=UPI003D770404
MRRLMRWCSVRQLGPLSDLQRHSPTAKRGERGTEAAPPPVGHLSEATRTRALAVVARCYRYWYDTGYLHANPAAGAADRVRCVAQCAGA